MQELTLTLCNEMFPLFFGKYICSTQQANIVIPNTHILFPSLLFPSYFHLYFFPLISIFTFSLLFPSLLFPSYFHLYFFPLISIFTFSLLFSTLLFPSYFHLYFFPLISIATFSLLFPSLLFPSYFHLYFFFGQNIPIPINFGTKIPIFLLPHRPLKLTLLPLG